MISLSRRNAPVTLRSRRTAGRARQGPLPRPPGPGKPWGMPLVLRRRDDAPPPAIRDPRAGPAGAVRRLSAAADQYQGADGEGGAAGEAAGRGVRAAAQGDAVLFQPRLPR